ncbi:MAG: class I SAM-dependent methyltransferase [Chloroflexota bacterium]
MPPSRPHEGPDRDAYELNRAWWDEVTPAHTASDFYDVAGFLAGKNMLDDFIVQEVGDVSGKSLLHLQCHFGLDTLSWARLGAHVTGVDISGEAIRTARRLAEKAGLEAQFVASNIYDLDSRFDGRFDIVFTSLGVLCWIGDLKAWGEVIARALKPGGMFYMAEFHPAHDMLQDERPILRNEDAYPGHPYFGGGRGVRFDPEGEDTGDYAAPDFASDRPTVEWWHSLAEIFGALTAQGLLVEYFNEWPFINYQSRAGMQQGDDGRWRFPPEVIPLPLTFSLRARKPIAWPW